MKTTSRYFTKVKKKRNEMNLTNIFHMVNKSNTKIY